jgi:EF-P beta-lysylation protein EpmB
MVARSGPGWQGQDRQEPDWKLELRQAFTRPEALRAFLGLATADQSGDARRTEPGFRMLVPRGYAALMEPGNPADPLLRQVLPLTIEDEVRPGFSVDPVGESRAALAPGLLQKYRGRALLVSTPACAIHCRYCFRRHFPYAHAALSADSSTAALAAIGADPTIAEVILSGGDPLMLDDEPLATLIEALSAIPHLQRLRIHTRLPVVLPARITPALCRVLEPRRLHLVVVIHANHPREISDAAGEALDRLRGVGAVLLNQSVLLRGVNDSPDTLCDLSERLFHCNVLPYYLHLLDRVQGAAHFEVQEAEARYLMSALRLRLPGYLVPRLVRETAGTATKIPIA